MNLPSRRDCYRLFHEHGMHDHIVAHSLQVCRTALFLADRLIARGHRLNRDLIEVSALLHDITKTRSLITGELHAQSGGELLAEIGYPEVGHLIRQHVRLDVYDPDPPITEAEIVNYADKRVLHDTITTFDDRLTYILERYGASDESRARILSVWDKTKTLQAKLFRDIDFPAHQLPEKIVPAGCKAEMAEYREFVAGIGG